MEFVCGVGAEFRCAIWHCVIKWSTGKLRSLEAKQLASADTRQPHRQPSWGVIGRSLPFPESGSEILQCQLRKYLFLSRLVLKDLINECKMAAFSLPSPQVPSDSIPGVRSNPVGNRANSPFLSAISIYLDARAVPVTQLTRWRHSMGGNGGPGTHSPGCASCCFHYLTQPSLYKWHNDGA